jgi:hypothetical protein
MEDQTNISDKVETKLSPSTTGTRMVKVLVKANNGIFKNSQQYDKGSEAVITLQSAEKFEALEEVQILGEVDANGQLLSAPTPQEGPTDVQPQ